MNDTIGPFRCEHISHGIAIANVDLVKVKIFFWAKLGKARLFQRHIIIIIEIIDADDLVTAIKQTQCAMHTNKASNAGDKRSQLKLQPMLMAQLKSEKSLF